MDITKPNIYDPADHPEEWTPEMYNKLEQARDIIEEWWLPNRRQLDRLGGVLLRIELAPPDGAAFAEPVRLNTSVGSAGGGPPDARTPPPAGASALQPSSLRDRH